MSEAVPIVYRVPDADRARFRASLGETANGEPTPDTDLACALFVEIYHVCTAVTRADNVRLTASIVGERDRVAVLSLGNVPALSLVACTQMQALTHAGTVYDIRCVFRHPVSQQPLDAGRVEVQFWRDAVPLADRHPLVYEPPAIEMPLAAAPDWSAGQLGLDAPHFATDRARLTDLLLCVRNMHSAMPIGIETTVHLVYAHDFYTGPGKRKRADDSAPNDNRRRVRRGDGGASAHLGYCVTFEHAIALPPINAAFMHYVKERIGPTLLNWLVLFPHTKPIAGSSSQVRRRGEVLAVVLRRADHTDMDVAPYTIAGVQWLVRRVDAALVE